MSLYRTLTPPTLPVDVSSRLNGLLLIAADVEKRINDFPDLAGLLHDYQVMARIYTQRFEAALNTAEMDPREKWLKQHEMLDKLTREWQLIYSLASSMELGSAFLEQFKPYVDQAVEDLGLSDPAGRDFLLLPVFGEKFSLVTVGYSSTNIAILNLPVSVIHSPWELSVIWHEMAGLKVAGIEPKIKEFLADYAKKHNLEPVEGGVGVPGGALIADLFRRIVNHETLDAHLLSDVREFFTNGRHTHHAKVDLWSKDWFEQLYEDACSILAFKDDFVPVLEKILRRQARKLTADWKHPDMDTRLQVARRLLKLQKGGAQPPGNDTERLTDDLLWAFIQESRSDPAASLPVAYAGNAPVPEIRTKLINDMRAFNDRFGDLENGNIRESVYDFSPMMQFAFDATQRGQVFPSLGEWESRMYDRLHNIFPADAGLDDLLKIPFSPSDELNFEEHDHNVHSWFEISQPMYTRASAHGGHYVLHLNHA